MSDGLDFGFILEDEHIDVDLNPFAYRGDDGKSPYVDAEGWWWEFDDETREYKKTDVKSDRDAAEKAQAAAQLATEAAGQATSAASSATDAAGKATEAAGAANDAASQAKSDVEAALEQARTDIDGAVEKANTATQEATEAAQKANDAADSATELSNKFSEVEFTVESLPANSEPTASVEQTETKTSFHLGVPTSNLAYSTFHVDDEMNLIMTSPETLADVTFALNENAELEVQIA